MIKATLKDLKPAGIHEGTVALPPEATPDIFSTKQSRLRLKAIKRFKANRIPGESKAARRMRRRNGG